MIERIQENFCPAPDKSFEKRPFKTTLILNFDKGVPEGKFRFSCPANVGNKCLALLGVESENFGIYEDFAKEVGPNSDPAAKILSPFPDCNPPRY